MDLIRIAHRVNTIEGLKKLPRKYGVEIDVRHDRATDRLYLNHDPAKPGVHYDYLDDYMKFFDGSFVVFNTKEAGIEQRCIDLAAKYGVPKSNYFLLDVEFPYLYRASRKEGVCEIAVRFSEAEPIEMTFDQEGYVDWCWIDTNNILPLYDQKYTDHNDQTSRKNFVKSFFINSASRQGLGANFKTCLVSPDRWDAKEADPAKRVIKYRRKLEELKFPLTAVMAGMEYMHLWE